MGVAVMDIVNEREKLLKDIKAFTREKRDLFRKIPLAALEVNGRHHWSKKLTVAYEKLRWKVDEFGTYIDLRTGELHGGDEHILQIAAHITWIDPEKILRRLTEHSEQELNPAVERPSDWETQKESRRNQLREFLKQ